MTKRCWFTMLYGVLLAIILLVVSVPSQAYLRFKDASVADPHFSQLQVKLDINKTGALQVTQQGILQGGNFDWQGLAQTIELDVRYPDGTHYLSDISIDSVKIDEQEVRYALKYNYDRSAVTLVISKEQLPKQGQAQQFEVRYQSKNRMRFYPALDELTYALFPNVNLKIKKLTVSILYPQTATLKEHQLFVDHLKNDAFLIRDGVVDGRNQLLFESQSEIADKAQGEIALAFEKGVFKDNFLYRKIWYPFRVLFIALPFLMLFALAVWQTRKRLHALPKLADAHPCSTQPPDLPICLVRELVAANIERMLTAKDVLAEVLKLAVAKQLTISERGKNNDEFSNVEPKKLDQIQINPEAPSQPEAVGLSGKLQRYFYQQQDVQSSSGKRKRKRVIKNRFVINKGNEGRTSFTEIICHYVNNAEVGKAQHNVNFLAFIVPILLWLSASFVVIGVGAGNGWQVFAGSLIVVLLCTSILLIAVLIVEMFIEHRSEDKKSREMWLVRALIYIPTYLFLLWMCVDGDDELVNGTSVVFHFFYLGFIAAFFSFIGPSKQFKAWVLQSQQFYQYIKLKSQHCFAEGVEKAEYEALLPYAYAFGLLNEWIKGYEAYLTAELDDTMPLIPWIRYKKITEPRELKQHLSCLEAVMPAISCSLYDRQPYT
ncbi:DUF2207 domain-containing protein [Pseudoalteromonas piscicida]|uniref:DUF2207 domain-containing protein n=1 Tax=Pseudoalteromonas piscicida TaxID=43662 RepID=UPI001C98B009|nr:DUF2207 domain-containing protein [Pseudoalteromonas piscicida]QZO13789.1 DUF2207 domain-containing protein [Pseudoalteromonas piscicida]